MKRKEENGTILEGEKLFNHTDVTNVHILICLQKFVRKGC